jgi:hypothetical protein
MSPPARIESAPPRSLSAYRTIGASVRLVKTVEGGELTSKELGLLDASETPTFAARPSYATVGGGAHWNMPLLLLTDRRLIISKDKLVGKRKADFAVPWSEVSNVSGELWKGGGPQIQLIVRSQRGDVELIVQPQYAVDVESAIRAGYLR